MTEEERRSRFEELLARLAGELKRLADTGDVGVLKEMHATIKEIYAVRREGEKDAIGFVDEDCEVIYRNFDMILAVLRTAEGEEPDKGIGSALNKFLHNINEAVINIASSLGLL